MPPKPKSDDVPDVVDGDIVDAPQSKDDADPIQALAVEATPPRKPDGAPDLVPFQRLRRRERGRLLRALAALDASKESIQNIDIDGDDDSRTLGLSAAADVEDVMADAEDVILSAAKDPAECEAWMSRCSDDELMGLLRWYMSVMQVGEASPSSD